MLPKQWSTATRFYYLSISLLGWGLVCSALLNVLAVPPRQALLVLPVALVLASRLYIQLPNLDGRISPITLLVLYTSLTEGLELAVLLTALEGIMTSLAQSQERTQRLFFNGSVLPLALVVANSIVAVLIGSDLPSTEALLQRSVLFATVFYLINMGLVLGMMVLVAGQRALQAARAALLWSWAEYLAGGLGAAFFVYAREYSQEEHHLTALLALFAIYLTASALQHYFKALRDKEKALTEKEEALSRNTELLAEKSDLLGKLEEAHEASLETLALVIEAKDPTTHGHVKRVQAVTLAMGRCLKLGEHELDTLSMAALLHDVGKLAIPEYILFQTQKQTAEELARYRTHANIGADILRAGRMDDLVPLVRHHHERFDGTGYPTQLSGIQIPMGARILAIADTYDKLRNPRSGEGLSHAEAMLSLESEQGTAFDPALVRLFLLNGEQMRRAFEDPNAVSSELPKELERPTQASLLQDLQSSHAEAMRLHALSQRLLDTLDPYEMMKATARAVEELVPADALLFLIYDERHDRLVNAFTQGSVAEAQLQDVLQRLNRHGLNQAGFFTLFERPQSETGPSLVLHQSFNAVSFPADTLRGALVLFHRHPVFIDEAQRRNLSQTLDTTAPFLAKARAYERVQRESTLDELTGLQNARALRALAPPRLLNAAKEGALACVVMMDLNGFKDVNDTLGHHAGDVLLVEVARIMQRHALPQEILARNGGDEFVMVITQVEPTALQERLDAIHRDACAIWPMKRENGGIGTSCGVAWLKSDGETLPELLHAADVKMYEDKRRKKGFRITELAKLAE